MASQKAEQMLHVDGIIVSFMFEISLEVRATSGKDEEHHALLDIQLRVGHITET